MYQSLLASLTVVLSLVAHTTLAADPDPKIPPIKDLARLEPNKESFQPGRPPQPIALATEKEAAAHFSEQDLAKLKANVDFTQQKVLLFAWQGSGQDKLTYSVAESFPEQIVFAYRGGLTRDLRPHVHIFIVRSNVKWSVGK